jgi:ferric-dicitrate binding protein FerR (iron transport regulator)
VQLADRSTLSYHPYWWRFNREVKLAGEALFTVQKGKRFTVTSAAGTTEVLGTTFRVTARSEIYTVACLEGSVRVTGSGSDVSATITANEQVVVHSDGRYSITFIGEERGSQSEEAEAPLVAFRSVPLQEVMQQIALHFGIDIRVEAGRGLSFSGNLHFGDDPERLLNAVCLPLELRYERTNDHTYVILPAEE